MNQNNRRLLITPKKHNWVGFITDHIGLINHTTSIFETKIIPYRLYNRTNNPFLLGGTVDNYNLDYNLVKSNGLIKGNYFNHQDRPSNIEEIKEQYNFTVNYEGNGDKELRLYDTNLISLSKNYETVPGEPWNKTSYKTYFDDFNVEIFKAVDIRNIGNSVSFNLWITDGIKLPFIITSPESDDKIKYVSLTIRSWFRHESSKWLDEFFIWVSKLKNLEELYLHLEDITYTEIGKEALALLTTQKPSVIKTHWYYRTSDNSKLSDDIYNGLSSFYYK